MIKNAILTRLASVVISVSSLIYTILIEPLSSIYRKLIVDENAKSKLFFSNKVVWVTGASSGIGRAISVHLAGYGAILILTARDKDNLIAVREECLAANPGCRVFTLPYDLSSYRAIESELFQSGMDLLKGSGLPYDTVDVLINNAGVSSRSSAVVTELETTEKIMAINFFGPVALTKAVLPGMITRGKGAIAVISSVQGKISIPNRSSYAASKHAAQGYFDSLRAEVTNDGISVTVCSPGYVKTSLSLNALNGDGSKYGVMDATTAKGLDPGEAAASICRAIAGRETDFILADAKTSAAILVRNVFPGLLAQMVKLKKTDASTTTSKEE